MPYEIQAGATFTKVCKIKENYLIHFQSKRPLQGINLRNHWQKKLFNPLKINYIKNTFLISFVANCFVNLPFEITTYYVCS